MPEKPPASDALLQKQKELQQVVNRMSSLLAGSSGILTKDVKITPQEFTNLRDFIYTRSGIDVPPSRKYLFENRLSSRLRELKLDSFAAYLQHLQSSPHRVQEETKLFELVTTNETSFFRNPPQLDIFQKQVLPELLERKRAKRNQSLHIWSAGCSSGEEPYTLGIILHEALKGELARWRVTISAHDISEAVLKTARAGIYSAYALRTTPKAIVQSYFEPHEESFRIRPEVQRLVRFGKINLNDGAQLRRVERADFIFCRNVIIYFDKAMKQRVIQAFEERLEPGGYLFIGHSETLHAIEQSFEVKSFGGSMVYRKPLEGRP